MNRAASFFCLTIALFAHPIPLFADSVSLVGLWRQFDDKTGKPHSLIRIREYGGQYEGNIKTIFPLPGEPIAPRCRKCSDWRKNKPLAGLLILTGMHGSESQGSDLQYKGGEILDPVKGQVYRCEMKLAEDGMHVYVRGYIGISLFGRTQLWEKVE